MKPIYTIDITCKCVKDCVDFDLKAGTIYKGRAELIKDGTPLFILYTREGSETRCLYHFFANFFELIVEEK